MFISFISLFLAALGLCCCKGAFSVTVRGGYSLVSIHRLLIAVASLVEHKPWGSGFSRCCVQAQMLCSTRNLPGLGIRPVSPALAGRFSTTGPRGKYSKLSSYDKDCKGLKNLKYQYHLVLHIKFADF